MLINRSALEFTDTPATGDAPSERLSQRAYHAIRASLRLGELRPGEKLILRPLAGKLGLSATPVREALLRLVSEQALGLDERSSTVVPTLTPDDLDEILELRIDLEGRAAELAARRGDQGVRANLDQIRHRFAAAVQDGNRHEVNWQDDRFHREILLASGRPTLVRIVENLQVRTGPLMALTEPATDGDGRARLHERMLDAMATRDGDAGRAAMTDGLKALFKVLNTVASERVLLG